MAMHSDKRMGGRVRDDGRGENRGEGGKEKERGGDGVGGEEEERKNGLVPQFGLETLITQDHRL